MRFLDDFPLVISDFSGTLTDEGVHLATYAEHFVKVLKELESFIDHDVLSSAIDQVRERPDLYPWIEGEFVIASVAVNPYMTVRCAVQILLKEHALFADLHEREAFMATCKRRYEPPATIVRDDAQRLLLAVSERGYVITDSAVNAVNVSLVRHARQHALSEVLAFVECDCILGGARKRHVDALLHVVEECLDLDGLDRRVELHRPHYYRSLEQVRRRAEVFWEDVLVVGDEFENDLALPLALGSHVVLVDNGTNVMPWERPFLEAHPRARIIDDLSEL